MGKRPGINHLDAVRALQKAGFRIARQGKHIVIERVILSIRGQRVLLDADLAALYGVSTRVLNQAVKRNQYRFPEDFMFRLTEAESEGDHSR